MTATNPMNMIWKEHEANPRLQKVLCEALGISGVFAQLLINRGIRTPDAAKMFLFGTLDECHDPFLMKDMAKAVDRVHKAVAKKEKILVYGDYDVDGVTSVAILSTIFDFLEANYETFIPNRLEEGYGMNIRAVARAREDGVKLIVTVDCGINSKEEVKCANDYGIDVIITDHHEIKEGEELPNAYAIIDTHQKDCKYPFKHLAGVGVAYKLARALMKSNEKKVDELLDLVALGTVADVAPQLGENRILTKAGLRELQDTTRPGLKALMEVARVNPETLACSHIGFALAPRINAMGRVGSANVALELLLCKEKMKARELARTLDKENRNRQSIEKDILKQASGRAGKELDIKKDRAIVLADEAWHPGVLGIVASRLTEEYNVPVILFSIEGDVAKGSGRSIDGFNLFEAIMEAKDDLIDFGGHEAACGVKVKRENIDKFKKNFNGIAKRFFTNIEEILPELRIDLNLPFGHVGLKLLNELRLLMPYGPGNSAPIFSSRALTVKNNPREIGKSGFKFLANCGSLTCEAVTFKKNLVTKPSQGNVIDLAYTPSVNSWQGIDTIQLNIKDLQVVKS